MKTFRTILSLILLISAISCYAVKKPAKEKRSLEQKIESKDILLLVHIDNFKEQFKELDAYRNFITHKGDYSETNLNLANSFLYMRDLKKSNEMYNDILKGGMSDKEFLSFLKNAVIKRLSDFNQLSSILHDWMCQFFILLEPELTRKIEEKS